jgi:hypothetical protein
MKCRLLRRRRAHMRASTPGAAIAAHARPDPCSTDPERLERLACEAEGPPRTLNGQYFLLRSLLRLSPRAEARLRAQRGDVEASRPRPRSRIRSETSHM